MTTLILFSRRMEFIKHFPLPRCDSLPTRLITTCKFYVLIIVLTNSISATIKPHYYRFWYALLPFPYPRILLGQNETTFITRRRNLISYSGWFFVGNLTNLCLTLQGLNFTSIIYKNSVCTSQETHRFSASNTSQLMLFREMVAVYCENQMKYTNTVFRENPELRYVKACGTYKNHCALKG
jgi:hypothetical protein